MTKPGNFSRVATVIYPSSQELDYTYDAVSRLEAQDFECPISRNNFLFKA